MYNLAMAATKENPKRLALWAVAGATLVACAFFISLLPFPHPKPVDGFWAKQWENRLHLLALFAPVCVGGTIWFLADKRLKRGYADGLWSDAELAPARDLLAEEYWTWTSVALFVVAVPAVAFIPHGGGLIYLVTCPASAASSLRRLLAPPIERTGDLIDWKNSKPLHSDHWGEAPRAYNDALPS